MGDGYLGKCKACAKNDVRTNYRKRREQYVAYERERYQRPERRAYLSALLKKVRALHPGKNRARNRISAALRDGKIVKPTACSRCGIVGRVEAHHHDYRKPFDVQWLCFRCHRSVEHGQIVT
jgi:hypothetical protein